MAIRNCTKERRYFEILVFYLYFICPFRIVGVSGPTPNISVVSVLSHSDLIFSSRLRSIFNPLDVGRDRTQYTGAADSQRDRAPANC